MKSIAQRFRLDGKVAIVTGASKGIGESIARGLAEFGAQVVICSRKQEAVDKVAQEFIAAGYKALGIACNVSKPEEREALVARTIEQFGRIDILINNAGTNPYFGPIQDLPAAAFEKTMEVNFHAAMELSNLCYPHLCKNGGSIIHISSVEGIHSSPGFIAYNISKSSVITLGKSQAVEWGKDNIRVNVICPGLVKTKLSRMLWENETLLKQMEKKIPLQRMAEPDEMAGLALFLASDAGSYCTGSVYVNDGGLLNAAIF